MTPVPKARSALVFFCWSCLALSACSNAPAKPGTGGAAGDAGGSTGSRGGTGSGGGTGTGGGTGGGNTGSGGIGGGSTGGRGGSGGSGGSGGKGAAGGTGMGMAGKGMTGTGSGGGASAGAVAGHPDPSMTYPTRPGFTLALVEEFNAPLDLNRDAVWTWSDGGLAEGDVRFSPEAITFADGKMVITVSRTNMPGSDSFAEPVTNGTAGVVATKSLRSGELRTRFNNFRYGRYEVRLKPPTSSGNFISTLFAFRTPKFQDWREIDIEVTADMPATVGTNVIYANNVESWNASIQDFTTALPAGPGSQPLPAGFNNQVGFHTYAFEWLPTSITWYVDDVPVRVKMGGAGLAIPEKSAKIIMNLWIFATAGGFGGDPTNNTYPMSSQYDWFRFYRWEGETNYPCAGPPACLPAEDLDKSKNNPDDGLSP